MGKKLIKRRIKLVSKDGKPLYWINVDTNKRFVGKARDSDGAWYWYGSKGHKTKLDDITVKEFLSELWKNENPNNKGLSENIYKPYYLYDSKGNKVTYNKKTAPRPSLVGKPQQNIGPGLDIYHMGIEEEARRGMDRKRVDQLAQGQIRQNIVKVNEYLSKATERPDTISPQIKKGLLDLRYQTGNLGQWKDLREAIIEGNIPLIQKEGSVPSTPSRNEKRNKNNWWYYESE